MLGPDLVPQTRAGQPRSTRPPAASVHDQPDVLGQGGTGQFLAEPAGIEAIGKVTQHKPNLSAARDDRRDHLKFIRGT